METEEYKEIITSKTRLKKFLNENNIALKKSFGQNFLYDKNVITNIIKNINFTNNSIIEIGPGLGALSLFYYNLSEKNLLIEIDKKLFQILSSLNLPNTKIVHNDILKINLKTIFEKNKKYIVVSNLPYNIATQILMRLTKVYDNIKELFIMVPDILYKRIIATPTDKNYSRITIAIQTFFKVQKLVAIKKNSFFPIPEIDSIFLKLTPHNKYIKQINNLEEFFKFVKLSFLHRRKKLQYIFNRYYNKIESEYTQKRIEEINIEKIVKIVNNIFKHKN